MRIESSGYRITEKRSSVDPKQELKIRGKCQKIAKRVMAGDKVSPADFQFLRKNKPDLFGKAVALQIEKENPKKYDRLSKNEMSQVTESTSSIDIGCETSEVVL